MIDVYNVNVEKTLADTHRIYWSARRSASSPTESVDDYDFQILFSFDPVSDFSLVGTVSGSTGPFQFEHTLKHTPHSREHYYRVRSVLRTTPTTYSDTITYYDGDDSDGIIKTIVYAERTLNNNYIGEPVYILKRKTDEARCPECWDPYQFRRTKTHCMTCRGTGFFDGFYKPIEAQISFERNPKIVEVGQTGEIQVTTIKARMSHYPLVAPRDLIVTKDLNERFTIVRVDFTKLPNVAYDRKKLSKNTYIISQMLVLSELPSDDDKFNVLIGVKDVRSYFNESEVRIPNSVLGNGQIVEQYHQIGQ